MTREEAIEVYNGLLNTKIKEAFEFFAPELRESEDERIRKELVEKISNLACGCFISEEQKQKFINYLEKQKEPKHAPDDLQKSFEAGQTSIVDNPEQYGLCKKPELIQQPPITYTYNANASRDERLKAALLALLNSDLIKVKEGGYFTKQDLIEWAERIPTDRPAWSEEDEKLLNYAISMTDDAQVKRFLNSLRSQPHKEIYQAARHDLAIKFMNYLDENRPEGKMSLSNGECEDIDKAFKENDWTKIIRYIEKYQPQGTDVKP